MFKRKITIGDYFNLLFILFENEEKNLIKIENYELNKLDQNLLKKEYQYYSFCMLLHLVYKFTNDDDLSDIIMGILIKMYVDKNSSEKTIIFDRIGEYLDIFDDEDDYKKAIEKAGFAFSEHVNGGLTIMMIGVTQFALFIKYNTDHIIDIINILKTQKKQF